ncbi:MAG: hypothetical protein C0493_12725 [Kytococcus sp.]|uniref:hypothetical protein n=1 Tax=Janibacter terrae TaxID=103817 RepID=UPI000838A488|nr:hypothetical protein [Janibacter terrae]MBA4085773.1 hypothetical protein [Kytococcus sp.]
MHPVVIVTGASGGLGASTLAAVTATVLARDGSPVLVDGAFASGGLDATVAAEHLDGLRWGDLDEHEGEVDAARLRRALPLGPVPVLAARGRRPSPGAVREVMLGLAAEGPVVVDLPAMGRVPAVWAELAALVVLVVGLRPRWLRDGEVVAGALGDLRGSTLLVTRGPRRAERVSERAAEHLGLPLLDHLADDPGVVRDEAHGRAPRPRGAVGEVARALAAELPGHGPALAERVLGLAS